MVNNKRKRLDNTIREYFESAMGYNNPNREGSIKKVLAMVERRDKKIKKLEERLELKK